MDLEELLAQLQQQPDSKKIDKKNEVGSKNQESMLGGYLPSSGFQQKNGRPNSSSGLGKNNKQSSSIDDVLQLFEEEKAQDAQKKRVNSFSTGEKNQGATQPAKSTTKNFFEELDFEDVFDKPSVQTNTINQNKFSNKNSESNNDNKKGLFTQFESKEGLFKEKRDSLFGISQPPERQDLSIPGFDKKQPGIFANSDGFSAASRDRDISPLLDPIEDITKTKSQQFFQKTNSQQQTFQQPLLASNQKSILDDSDEFPTIDFQHSRRARSTQRRASSIINKEEKSNSPPFGAKTSANLNLEDDEEVGFSYNPSSASKIPSKARVSAAREQIQVQRPPRLMKTHEESQPQLISGERPEKTEIQGKWNDNEFQSKQNENNEYSRFGKRERGNNFQDSNDNSDLNSHVFANPRNAQKPPLDAPVKQIFYDSQGVSGIQQQTSSKFPKYQSEQELSVTNSIKNNIQNNQDELMFKNTEIFNKETVSADFFKNSRNIEDIRGAAQTEAKRLAQEEVSQQIAHLKVNFEKQIKMIKDSCEEQILLEKKMRQDIIEDMQGMQKAEKERMMIIHESDIKAKEQAFEYERQQLQRTFQQESEMLQRQIQQQAKMINLTEDIRLNADKLNSLQNKIQDSAQIRGNGNSEDLKRREDKLAEDERRLKVELEFVENERNRIQRQKEEFDVRESQLRVELETEKSTMRKEYGRLSELQEQMAAQDQEKRRQLIFEKQQFLTEKADLQEEKLKMKEEFELKYRDFETEVILFKNQRKSECDQAAKLEAMYREKLQEAELIRNRLIEQEAIVARKLKSVEVQMIDLRRRETECVKIEGVSGKERREFEAQEKRQQEQINKIDMEWEEIMHARKELENDRINLQNQRYEISQKQQQLNSDARNVQKDKSEIITMQRTLQSIKHGVITQIQQDSNKSKQLSASVNGQLLQQHIQTDQENINNNYQNILRQTRSNSLSSQRIEQLNYLQNVSVHPRQTKPNIDLPKSKISLKKHSNIQKFEGTSSVGAGTAFDQNTAGFNLNDFMSQLKIVDQTSNFNQAYITKERENLFIKAQFAADQSHNNNNGRSGSYTQSQFCDSSPYLNKPSSSSGDSRYR